MRTLMRVTTATLALVGLAATSAAAQTTILGPSATLPSSAPGVNITGGTIAAFGAPTAASCSSLDYWGTGSAYEGGYGGYSVAAPCAGVSVGQVLLEAQSGYGFSLNSIALALDLVPPATADLWLKVFDAGDYASGPLFEANLRDAFGIGNQAVGEVPPTQYAIFYMSLASTGTLDIQFGNAWEVGLHSFNTEAFEIRNDFNFNNNEVVATPEPGTIILLGSGLLAVGGVVRRRRNAAA